MIGARLLPPCVGPIEQELPFHPKRGRSSSHENSRGNGGMFQRQPEANTKEFSFLATGNSLWNDLSQPKLSMVGLKPLRLQ